MLYEVLKTAKMGAGKAPDLYTALLAKNLRRDGEVKTLSGIPPLTFRSNGQPLLDYLISGNTVQSGTPIPDNPVMSQGTGERTGNLFSSVWEKGAINTNGQNEPINTRIRTVDYIEVKPNTIYSMSRNINVAFMNVRFYKSDKSFAGIGSASTIRLISGYSEGNPMYNEKFCCFEIIDNTIKYMRCADQSNNLSTKYMMVEGEYTEQTMPAYEPYGIKIPISSANTTTNVYLGEVETTRKIQKLVLTGEETFVATTTSAYYRCRTTLVQKGIAQSTDSIVSTHYFASAGARDGAITLTSDGGSVYFTDDINAITAESFKSYLAAQYAAGTPVTVWYVLATPTTGIVNEPLMKIGDYADTLSMEQAGVEIPTARGTNTLDVLTDVKPSEVYIKYKE